MLEAKNVRVLFIDDSDIENPELPVGCGALTQASDEASLSADIIIYKNTVTKNRYGNATRLSLLLGNNVNSEAK
ncbi:hypothetical protein [Pantoea ananatis]|uniref:hypothetical protein n=1 Tax=Pantoea ananas TaxID=553 RepID=UPI001B3158E1|nr:hypothetical protein [Pantoea ananatis]